MSHFTSPEAPAAPQRVTEGRILVVDDDRMTARMHSALLADAFDVSTATSGEEALEACAWEMPDLILLDIAMPGIDGLETCRRLRDKTRIPILFATGQESPEEHLKAFEAGGSDIFIKPVSSEILHFKVRRAIARHREEEQLRLENAGLSSVARDVMHSLDESTALLGFMRSSVGSRTYEQLARNFVSAAQSLGVQCSLIIRQNGCEAIAHTRSTLTSLERVALAHGQQRGRHFLFRDHLGINTHSITVLIGGCDNPDSESSRRLRECMTHLADAAEALTETVAMRLESSARAEQMQLALAGTVTVVNQLRDEHRMMIADVRMLLQTLSDQMEQTFSWLATDHSQEREINERFSQVIEKILRTLLRGSGFDASFEQIIQQLSARQGGGSDDIELF